MLKRLLAFSLFFLSGLGIGIAGNYVFGTPEVYGPFVCDNCTLRNPAPDPGTQAYLGYINNWLKDGPNYKPLVGDRFVMCTSTHCATYTRTASDGYMGSPATPQEVANGGGGGGGDGDGGRGAAGGNVGTNPPRNNWGNEPPMCNGGPCNGRVTVGGN